MKVVVSAVSEGLDAQVDQRFGRAQFLSVVTIENDQMTVESLSNVQNFQAAQGAGIQAANTVAQSGATKLITGHVGPKAFNALSAGNIEVYTGANGTVKEAVQSFLDGKYKVASGADVGGHW